jgi:glucuronate isomerase
MSAKATRLDPDRYFDPNPAQRRAARELYESVKDLPIISPHSHVDPALFLESRNTFGSPADLLIIPDHYVFRMLYSQGISLSALGIPRRDGGPVETDHRAVWQCFADHFYLFRGTPTGMWLTQELVEVFGVNEKLNGENAQVIYDQLADRLASPAFSPRALFERFNIEVLCTTDAATSPLEAHRALRESGWAGNLLPTFRADSLLAMTAPDWRGEIERLSQVSGVTIHSFASYIQAIEQRRVFFKANGAVATDQAADSAYSAELKTSEVDQIFQRALKGEAGENEARRFNAHMLMESARMSIEDGLVMQIHVGSLRDHNTLIFSQFGPNLGADIPTRSEFTRNLKPLLNKFGNDPRLTLIVFNLDESNYARELAPLAGHYPAMRLGPPWWFHDSLNGINRYFDQVIDTAGLYNTVGFNDDTRAFPSIPARHDVWRRASANWIAGAAVRGIVDRADAEAMIRDAAYGLAKRAYNFD